MQKKKQLCMYVNNVVQNYFPNALLFENFHTEYIKDLSLLWQVAT